MKKIICILLLASFATGVRADWRDLLGINSKSTNSNSTASGALAGLSSDQVGAGLKDALGNGLQHAIAQLGHTGGFLTNLDVKIPVPEKLQTVEKGMRALGEQKMVDDFIGTMNHAAEQAVPEAASVFADSVKQMTFDDAKNILTGPQNAATEYFRRTTETNLYARFLPIVQQATAKNGVTSSYKNMMTKFNGTGSLGSLGGLANNYLGGDATDLDAYVTHRSLDGLFKMVANEEQRIRQNPAARTTDLMKQVFGAVAK